MDDVSASTAPEGSSEPADTRESIDALVVERLREQEDAFRAMLGSEREQLLNMLAVEVQRQFHASQTTMALETQRQLELVHSHLIEEMHRQFLLLDQRLEDRFNFSSQKPPTHLEQSRILELAAYFAPRQLEGCAKVRIGADHDGGYILADKFAGAGGVALSLGVADEISWDQSMADAGYVIHQFDHTVEGPPSAHENFRFQKKKIVAEPGEGGVAIADVLSTIPAGVPDLILKMDIEGDEWGVLEALDDASLARFSQIVCEFHNFRNVDDDQWFDRAKAALKKLSKSFDVVHVHANNYGALTSLGSVPFPDLLEVTLVNRDKFKTAEGVEYYPTPIDKPNRADRPDIFLGTFRFSA